MNDLQFLRLALKIIYLHPDEFRAGFDDWIYDNVPFQRVFNDEALAVVKSGRTHYSAYIIIQYLRHYTAMRSIGDYQKISNDWTPSIARLFGYMYPAESGIFDYHQLFGRTMAN